MEFKIDTNPTFSTIRPLFDGFNAKLTDELLQKCEEVRQSGSHNFIIDLQKCSEIDNEGLKILVMWHELSYSQGESLVFTGINDKVMTVIKNEEADLLLNIARTMQEAIDIVSMEILERELFDEE